MTEGRSEERAADIGSKRRKESNVGLFWDLIQQSQISEQRDRAATLEERVAELERRVARGEQRFLEVLQRLERALEADLDSDGRIG